MGGYSSLLVNDLGTRNRVSHDLLHEDALGHLLREIAGQIGREGLEERLESAELNRETADHHARSLLGNPLDPAELDSHCYVSDRTWKWIGMISRRLVKQRSNYLTNQSCQSHGQERKQCCPL